MEDIFDSLYVVVAIIIFISSIVRKRLKAQQQNTAKKPVPHPRPVTVPKCTGTGQAKSAKPAADFDAVREELAELFGIRPAKPPAPKPKPVEQEKNIPVVAPKKTVVPEKVAVTEEKTLQSRSFEQDRTEWQQRIIWAEVLGPPKAIKQS